MASSAHIGEFRKDLPLFCPATGQAVAYRLRLQQDFLMAYHENCDTQAEDCAPTVWRQVDGGWMQSAAAAELPTKPNTGSSFRANPTGSEMQHDGHKDLPLPPISNDALPTRPCSDLEPRNEEQHHNDPSKRSSTSIDLGAHDPFPSGAELLSNKTSASSETVVQDGLASDSAPGGQDADRKAVTSVPTGQAPCSRSLYTTAPVPVSPTLSSSSIEGSPAAKRQTGLGWK